MHVPQADRKQRNSLRLCALAASVCAASEFFGIHFSHGTIQNRLVSPSTIKNERQPNRPMSMPPKSMPNPGPSTRPEAITELAKPRCSSGKFSATIFEYEG